MVEVVKKMGNEELNVLFIFQITFEVTMVMQISHLSLPGCNTSVVLERRQLIRLSKTIIDVCSAADEFIP